MRRKSLLFPTDSIPGRFPGTARKTPKARFSTPTTAGGSEQRHRDTGTAPTLSLVHLDRQAGNAPGAPQEAEARSRAVGRGAQRSGGASPSPHRGGGLHPRRRRPPKGQARRVPSRQATTTHPPPGRQHHKGEREGKRGRAGFRTPAFHAPPRGGVERRGARRQNEKSGPIRHECPSLAWRGLGPAQESAHSPHRSQ